MTKNKFETETISEKESGKAKKIVEYSKARDIIEKLLNKKIEDEEELEEAKKIIRELDPLKIEKMVKEKGGVVDKHLLDEIEEVIKKSGDKELVKRLSQSLEKEKADKKIEEVKKRIDNIEREIQRILEKLETFSNVELDEESRKILENDKKKMEALKLEKEKIENELKEEEMRNAGKT